jgi:hypothetical protein
VHVYCWDLDRTYLDTDIHSVRGMVRAALETASEKRNIPGSATLLRALLQFDPSARATILSGSPEQMRSVLSEKLTLDGIAFDTMVLKDNLRNIRKGRFRAVRGQLGYKLPQLLAMRCARPVQAQETLFGDDSEADALVYALYRELIAGRMPELEMVRLLQAGGAYDDQIELARRSLSAVPPADAVRAIYIHADRRRPIAHYDLLGGEVIVVSSWLQAALRLWLDGRLGVHGVETVAQRCTDAGALGHPRLVALFQDAVRRSIVPAEALLGLLEGSSVLEHLVDPTHRALAHLGDYRRFSPAAHDWDAFQRLLHAG